MNAVRSLPAGCGFVLTDKGREDLLEAERCECRPTIDRGFVVCRECGTCYGLLRHIGQYHVYRPLGEKDR